MRPRCCVPRGKPHDQVISLRRTCRRTIVTHPYARPARRRASRRRGVAASRRRGVAATGSPLNRSFSMLTRSALLPLAVAAGLAAVPSAMAAKPSPVARAAGGDAPPVVPSLIQTRITRTENALERLTRYVDNGDSAKVVKVGKVIRRQTSAAWRGAKYYL